MTSKASRLRAKKARAGELAGIPRRAKQGRRRMAEIKATPPKDESVSQIEIRCRKAGIPATPENLREMKAQWQGCEAGRAMSRAISDEAERLRLWDAIQHIRRACMAYDRAIDAPARTARSLRLMLPSLPAHPDARTDADRVADAKRDWAQVELMVARYGRYTASITLACVLEDHPCRDATSMVLALQNVADRVVATR